MWGAFSHLGELTSTIDFLNPPINKPSATALVNKPLPAPGCQQKR